MNWKRYIVLLLIACAGVAAKAQQTAAALGCKDAAILTQSAELRYNLEAQGFEVLNSAMLDMQSRSEYPIMVRMQQGAFYQIVFTGNTRSSRINLDLMLQRRMVLHKEQRPMKQTSNVISFSFSPQTTADYTFMLSQVIRSGSSCGSFTIFKLKNAKP